MMVVVNSMRIRLLILIIILMASALLMSQNNLIVDWNVAGQSFQEFVSKAEASHPVRFFYNEEWIRDVKLGDYGQGRPLKEILDTLFKGRSIYYYTDGADNIIITKYFAIKPAREIKISSQSYIPGIDYGDGGDGKNASGNLVVDLGNPADKSKPGSVIVS